MCRDGTETLAGGGTCERRRCPSSQGERRRAADRQRYRLRTIAENLEREVEPAPAAPATASAAPTLAEIRDAQQRSDDAFAAITDTTVNRAHPSPEHARYEQAVREVGDLVHARAVHEHGIDTQEDPEAVNARFAEQLTGPEQRAADADAALKELQDRSAAARLRGLDAEESAQFARALEDLRAAREEIREAYEQHRIELLRRHNERVAAYRAVLAEVQEIGGDAEMDETQTAKRYRNTREVVRAEAQQLPAAWVRQSNEAAAKRPFYVRPSKGRAHYTSLGPAPIGEHREQRSVPYTSYGPAPQHVRLPRGWKWQQQDEGGEAWNEAGARVGQNVWVAVGPPKKNTVAASVLTVSGDDDAERRRVACHEFSHRIESYNRRVSLACIEFRRRRTTRDDGTIETVAPIYGGKEPGWRDHFVAHYVGRDYGEDTQHSEVFSMGSEALWHGSHGGLVGDAPNSIADPEHRNLILGLYATAK